MQCRRPGYSFRKNISKSGGNYASTKFGVHKWDRLVPSYMLPTTKWQHLKWIMPEIKSNNAINTRRDIIVSVLIPVLADSF